MKITPSEALVEIMTGMVLILLSAKLLDKGFIAFLHGFKIYKLAQVFISLLPSSLKPAFDLLEPLSIEIYCWVIVSFLSFGSNRNLENLPSLICDLIVSLSYGTVVYISTKHDYRCAKIRHFRSLLAS